ncbi:hypothetical protein [Riemerella columbina]|uniref:hypothetical protein n=1 Tax=Riemerella columbina TaxID=103810 RepID=UPI00266F8460|nr:hypothetical protein [Riemerella columbina]WKS95275.1 hypothetical protein NYR17_00625 [Riemerella columbina]
MNLKSFFSIVFIAFGLGFSNAQVAVHPMLKVGYQYQNSNFGEVGGTLLFLKNDDALYRLGGSVLLGSANGNMQALPKLQADILLNSQKGKSLRHAYYYLLGAEASPKHIAPKVGISLFGILDFTGGYAFQISDKTLNGKALHGIQMNLTLHIPLVVFKK